MEMQASASRSSAWCDLESWRWERRCSSSTRTGCADVRRRRRAAGSHVAAFALACSTSIAFLCPSEALKFRGAAFAGFPSPARLLQNNVKSTAALCRQLPIPCRKTVAARPLSRLMCQTSSSDIAPLQTFFPAAERIIAIGDVHGDANSLRACLNIAGVMDRNNKWIGGATNVVQVGDILDRGEQERECLDILLNLQQQAEYDGGKVHILLGNHEVLNADLDFAYVAEGAWDCWEDFIPRPAESTTAIDTKEVAFAVPFLKAKPWFKSLFDMLDPQFEGYMLDRVAALRPGGFVARQLARMPVCVQIGDTVLVHAGIQTSHLRYGLERINHETSAWLEGRRPGDGIEPLPMPEFLSGNDSPVWMRDYSTVNPRPEASEELDRVLSAMGARRMVVGHTVHPRGINAHVTRTGKEVWRCDTGMCANTIGGPREVLEILSTGQTNVLTEAGPVSGSYRSFLALPPQRARVVRLPPPPPPAAATAR